MSKDKDKAGNYFSMDEGGQRGKEARQSRHELANLRNQFMNRAKQFMDDSAIGEGRKMVEKFIGKVQDFVAEPGAEEQEEAWEGEMLDESTPETAFAPQGDTDEDDEDGDWEEREPEELDWSRPEYIRAGYAKPGTKVETLKSLEEAQEESFSLKMGNLSGLLSRFGSEDASPELEQRSFSRHRMEMDKPLFRSQLDQLYAQLAGQIGTETDSRLWLHPEVLTMLRAHNQPHRILLFAMAALFAVTSENYLTEADQDWIRELMERAGFLLEPKEIQRVVEQTFVFPERVHRLYENLLNEPLMIAPEHFDQFRENLSKLYIYEVATRYGADPRNVIRTLASQWQAAAQGLQQALAQAAPISEQYARFVQKKMASATIFHKLRLAQEAVLRQFEGMQQIAREVEALKQVTRLIEEEDALERLNAFRTDMVLPPEACMGDKPISIYDLREKFITAQLEALRSHSRVPGVQAEALELSPVEQKHAIARAKEGEIKSLRLIETFKAWRIAQLNPEPEAQSENPPAPASAPAAEAPKAGPRPPRPAAPPQTSNAEPTSPAEVPAAAETAPRSAARAEDAEMTERAQDAAPRLSESPQAVEEVYAKIPGAEAFNHDGEAP